MPIKEKSIYKKHSYEYEGPEEDKWDFVVIETEGRVFVQFNKEKEKPITMDGEMLLEMADAYRRATSKIQYGNVATTLQKPQIEDHRGLDQSEAIQSQVDEAMDKQDHSIAPIQNLTPDKDNYAEFRTGVNVDNQAPVPDTPADYSLKEKGEMKMWQKDAISRKEKAQLGDSQYKGKKLKRIGAGDII